MGSRVGARCGALLAALFLTSLSGSAAHCTTWSSSGTTAGVGDAPSPVSVPTDAVGITGYYVHCHYSDQHKLALADCWIYEETNGLGGLQRSDDFADDTCHGMVEPDTIFF